jgi:prevent-host-death family protein
MSMIKISAAEFQRDSARYQELAQDEPVAILQNGEERAVIISAGEYRRLKRRDRQVLVLDDFNENDVAALEASRAPDAAKAFDHELD